MIYLKAVLLAVVEGITEFLPISSTGHLILVESWVRLSDDETFNNAFMVVVQAPAILSVLVYFWKDLWPFGTTPETRNRLVALWGKIIVAVAPAIALGPFLNDYLEEHLFAPVPVAVALLVGGIVLIFLEGRLRGPTIERVADIPVRLALLIGLFQCFAMVPGTSRSAATIIGAMLLGASRPAAAEFSFFLAIPTLGAATVYSLVKSGVDFTQEQWMVLGVGSIVSFVVAYSVIAVFMSYVRRRSFAAFGYYRIALAVLVLAAAYWGWIGAGS